MNNNKINLIELTAFKGLTELKHLQLQNNFCINKAESNYLDVENLIESSKIICSKIVVELQQKILKIDEKFSNIIEEISNESKINNIWIMMKKEFKRYTYIKNNNNKDEKIKIISNRTDLSPDDKLVDLNYELIINSVLDSINMTNILNDMENLKAIIAESQTSKTNFKYLIFLLIVLSLLTYSCNFIIMYCLYPNTDELGLNNLKKNMSVENIYNDISVQYIPN